MQTKTYVIGDALGMHARPAGMIAKEAQRYRSSVTVTVGGSGKSASAKGLFGLLGLEARQGDALVLCAEGVDEAQAMHGVGAVIEERLGASSAASGKGVGA